MTSPAAGTGRARPPRRLPWPAASWGSRSNHVSPRFCGRIIRLRLQLVGNATGARTVVVDGERDGYIVRYTDGDGRLVGALAANRPERVATLRTEIAADAAHPPAKAA